MQTLLTTGVTLCKFGYCTNPFDQGCLKSMQDQYGEKNMTKLARFKNAFEKIRMCNSGDFFSDENGTLIEDVDRHCRRNQTWKEYYEWDEIRLANSDWGTSILYNWILQIIMTEVLEIPTVLEQGITDLKEFGSFYDYHTNFIYPDYGNKSELDALLLSSKHGDCNTTEPCAHVIPDIYEYDFNEAMRQAKSQGE